MKSPQVSICIPIFNAESTLRACLESALAQEGDNEILVLDNCSTDGGPELARDLLKGRPRGRVVGNPENLGRIGNWNRCIDVAEGQFVKFLMASDVLLPGSLALLVQEALAGEPRVIVASRHQFWDGEAARLPRVVPPADGSVQRFRGLETLEYVRDGGNPFWALNGMLIAREFVEQHRIRFGETPPYLTDVIFCAQLSVWGVTSFLPTTTYWFNRGAKTRHHYTGFDAGNFLLQVRQFQEEVNRLLSENGGSPGPLSARLLDAFEYCLFEENKSIDLRRLPELFPESRTAQAKAAVLHFLWRIGMAKQAVRVRDALRLRRRRAARRFVWNQTPE